MEQKKEKHIVLKSSEVNQMELLTEYVTIETDYEKSKKVIRTISRDFPVEVYLGVYRTAMSFHEDKADIIFRFLQDAFRVGRRVCECLTLDSVSKVFEIGRNVMYETHHYYGFVRFSQTGEKVLLSVVSPKNNILPMIVPHFADRMPQENWMIYDEKRQNAVLHQAGKPWILVRDEILDPDIFYSKDKKEEEIQKLWKTFFDSVAIESRKNPKLQINLLPLHFRDKMTEFI